MLALSWLHALPPRAGAGGVRAGATGGARPAARAPGRLRGQIAEMQVQLVRARQDQERYQVALDRYRAVRERVATLVRWRRHP